MSGQCPVKTLAPPPTFPNPSFFLPKDRERKTSGPYRLLFPLHSPLLANPNLLSPLHYQTPISMAIPCHQFIFAEKPSMEKATPMPAPISSPILTQDELKRMAAYKAVEFVESGMVVGLGTGSTAIHAVARIAELMRQGKLQNIVGIATSKKTEEQAIALGIPLSDLDHHPFLDLVIDGADEVDPLFNLIKGRGGSLLREKMVESACRKFVVIVDETKLVEKLGASGFAMPVEVQRFCPEHTARKLQSLFPSLGCVAKLKMNGDKLFETDNLNFIVDLFFERGIDDLNATSDAILRLPGVAEHGLFVDLATTLIVAGSHGVVVKEKVGAFGSLPLEVEV